MPDMLAYLPYVPAVIELEDAPGVRLVSNLVDVEVSTVDVDMKVSLVWDDQSCGVSLPRFVPANF